jgi:hypothetical protein
MRIKVRAGRDLVVRNLSGRGALVEGPTRLLPGTRVTVHVTSPKGRVLVDARVLRCSVCHLSAEGIGFRAALAFDTVVDVAEEDGYFLPGMHDKEVPPTGTTYPPPIPTTAQAEDKLLNSNDLASDDQSGTHFGS